MKKKEAKKLFSKKVIIYSLIILSLFLLTFFLKVKIEKETKAISSLRMKIEENKAFLNNFIEIQKEKRKAEGYQKTLRALVPKDPSFLTLAYQAKYIAKEAGVDFNFNFAKQEEGDISINFSIKGSKENVLLFLNLLKKAPFFLSLDKMTWSEDGKEVGVVGSGHFYFYQTSQKNLESGK